MRPRRATLLCLQPPDKLESMAEVMPRITIDPAVCGGQACVRGLRVPVSLVLRHVAAGQSPDQIVAEYSELEVDDVAACLRFAAWLASGRALDLPDVA